MCNKNLRKKILYSLNIIIQNKVTFFLTMQGVSKSTKQYFRNGLPNRDKIDWHDQKCVKAINTIQILKFIMFIFVKNRTEQHNK